MKNEKNNSSFYIEFLNAEKKFTADKIYFDSLIDAIEWGRKNLDKFNIDLIKVN